MIKRKAELSTFGSKLGQIYLKKNPSTTDRQMQLSVIVENIVSSELVQLGEHAQPVVGLELNILKGI